MSTKKDPEAGKSCKVLTPSAKLRAGTYANAFRIIPDVGEELLLDFCVYTQTEQEASVVQRIRVTKKLLEVIKHRVDEALLVSELEDEPNDLFLN